MAFAQEESLPLCLTDDEPSVVERGCVFLEPGSHLGLPTCGQEVLIMLSGRSHDEVRRKVGVLRRT